MSKVAEAKPRVQNINALAAIQRGKNPASASPAKHTANRAVQKKIHFLLVETESTKGPHSPFKNHGKYKPLVSIAAFAFPTPIDM